ncbi:hypothetical protein [Agromyces indicus]|uniref:Uncharacterized protein n=1 Tax=Agromyces indicus TaxID=758919 RepID=A0ABU1FJH1_9MICO|nr:hypothetical protein [Agromyces indicus]MDR5691914.1 hypothetical protein [Agromyces indicus]
MGLRLQYGEHKITVDSEVDPKDLRGGVAMAAGGDGWLQVPTKNGIVKWIFVTPGVPILVEEFDEPAGRSAVVF